MTTNEQRVSVNPVYRLLVFLFGRNRIEFPIKQKALRADDAHSHVVKMNICKKKCVACQRKSSLYDRTTLFLMQKREEWK